MKLQLSLADISILYYILNWNFMHENNIEDVSIQQLQLFAEHLAKQNINTNHELIIDKFNLNVPKPYQPYIFYKSINDSIRFNPNISKTEYMSFISFLPREIYNV
jgi:hypothetical protein